MNTMAISTADFVEEMERHWTERLGNVSSEALRKVWHQLAATFGRHILSHSHPDQARQWTVLQPPTGSGKSQGTIVYCSMLSRHPEHPGVLIVTRLKADADEMARQINDLSGRDVAVAYHSDSKNAIDIASLKNWPVLIITHRAYELALDYLGRDGTIQKTWPLFHAWNDDRRELVVIDECLDIVEQSQAGLDGLRHTWGAIPQHAREKFPNEIRVIQDLIGWFEQIDTGWGELSGASLFDGLRFIDTPLDFTELRRYLRDHVRFDYQIRKNDTKENERLTRLHDERLRSIHCLLQSWFYYARVNRDHTFNTARLLVPEGVKGAVVLDATASSNVLYEVFPDADVIAPPPGSRVYGNVILHVSRGNRLGKGFMAQNAKEVSSDLVCDLNVKLPGRRALVVCHKHVEPVLASHETTFTMNTAHWGKIDGSNEWKDCDTAVIFGLPYRPDTWTANVFMACQGVQDDEWLRGSERPFGGHQDIRRALKTGQMIVNIVQAINRVRCRKVIDDQGNCPETDIFIMLPPDQLAEEIIKGIKAEMPGIRVIEDWDFSGRGKKPKRSNHEQALIKYFQNMDSGSQALGTVKKALGISQATMERLTSLMKNPESALAKAMEVAGARYAVEGRGRGTRTRIEKG